MPDITMCKGDKCPLRLNCYRFKAIPSKYWQTYFTNVPYNKEFKSCEYFWKNKKLN